MTIGIYKLVFEGTDKVYVGQSINIERRFTNHLSSLRKQRASPQLQNAYNKYGAPIYQVLEECHSTFLDTKEIEFVHALNSFNNGYL